MTSAIGAKREDATPAHRATPPPLPDMTPRTPASVARKVGEDPLQMAALALLKLEIDIRQARTLAELAYFITNEPRQIMRAHQVILLHRGRRRDFAVRAVSSVTHVDRSSPLILWFEKSIKALGRERGLAGLCQFEASMFSAGFESVVSAYPLRHLLWVPWPGDGEHVMAGMLLARTTPWSAAETAIGRHLAATFAHAWTAIAKSTGAKQSRPFLGRRTMALAAVTVAAMLAMPVSMSALAPVEVVPRDPFIVTSGVEGVVKSVLVEPNEPVKKDQVLLRMADTVLKNRFDIAEREVAVAEAKYKKAAQLAFVDARGRHELGLARAELELKIAEHNYALDLLSRAEIKAERDGIAFFGDKKDLIGRPVAVGEKLMEVANPADMEFRIDLGVADAIVLRDGARVKVFLDSDPLNPIEARLVRAGYQAKLRDNQQLAFRLVAEALEPERAASRLGVRGTAQVYSDKVPLGFYLFRRPIAVARQWLGL